MFQEVLPCTTLSIYGTNKMDFSLVGEVDLLRTFLIQQATFAIRIGHMM